MAQPDGAQPDGGAPDPQRCDDRIRNGNETGVDCGGDCPPCADPAKLLRLEPALIPNTGDQQITLVGEAFVAGPGLRVLVDNVPAADVRLVDATHIVATPAARPQVGDADVTLILQSGQTRTLAKALRIYHGTIELSLRPRHLFGVALGTADLNGDGKMDVAVYDDMRIYTYLGNGDGMLRAASDIASQAASAGLFTDINGDGKPDLLTYSIGGAANLYLGKGGGAFEPERSLIPSGARGLAAGDVNGDGKPDVLVSKAVSDTVSLLPGKGDGSFEAAKAVTMIGYAEGLALADLNRDGALDLVAGSSPNYLTAPSVLSVALGNGAGGFAAATRVGTGNYVSIADMNGDGFLDLITGTKDAGAVHLGKGDGSFGAGITNDARGLDLAGVVSDVNGDGKPDLVRVYLPLIGTQELGLFYGNGDGTLLSARRISEWPSPGLMRDMNGDGKVDLVVAAGIALGRGDGIFLIPQVTDGPAAEVQVADANGDGRLDAVTVNPDRQTVSALLGNGDGTFQVSKDALAGAPSPSLALGDFNGDSILDVALHQSLLPGKGDGTYGTRQMLDLTVVGPGQSLTAGYLDGDTRLDLLSHFSVLLGRGGGTFQSMPPVAVEAPLALADMDGDGRADLVMQQGIRLGKGDGSFAATKPFPFAGPKLTRLTVGDLDQDGALDVVFGTDALFPGLAWLPGKRDGTVGAAVQIGMPDRVTGLALADLDGDKRLDVVYCDSTALWVLRGNGGGRPSLATRVYGAGATLAMGDLDGDGRQDVVLASKTARYVLSYLNRSH